MSKLETILEKYDYEVEGEDPLKEISEFNDDLSVLAEELKQAQNKIKTLQQMDNSVLSNSNYLSDVLFPLTRLLSHPLMTWANTFQKEEIQNELNDSFIEDLKIEQLTKKILADNELAQHLLVKAESFTQKGK
jgi:hypothetical protein